MPTFRPYTDDELRDAAIAYDLDPAFVEAVYAVESSRGTNPKAMSARAVKRKRDSTIVRGPFQLEDDTTSDLIRKHKLGNVNVDDPDVHLDLALRLMRDLKNSYGGDYRKVAQAYLGGSGGVTNPKAKDELGTSTGDYGNKILAEMAKIKGVGTSMTPMVDLDLPAPGEGTEDRLLEMQPFMNTAETDDIFGMSNDMMASRTPDPNRVSWSDLVLANRGGGSGLGIPPTMGGDLPDPLEAADDTDINQYIAQLVDEELSEKDYASA